MDADEYADRVGQEVTRTFRRLSLEVSGESPEVLGRRLAISVGSAGIWEERFGPLLSSARTRSVTGKISREALSKRVRTGKVLRLKDDRGQTRYPSWQFDPKTGDPYPVMVEVIRMFRNRGADEWEIASFCTDPAPELDGMAPKVALVDGDESAVLAAARRALARLYD